MCEEFRRQRDSNPAPLSKGNKVFSLKLKQYDENFLNYNQVNWWGRKRRLGGGAGGKSFQDILS